MLMNTIQIQQLAQFLSAYPRDVAEAGIEAWRTGEMPDIQGMVSDVPLAQNYNELTEEAKQFIKEESERMRELMPLCKCGKQLALVGVCAGCPQGEQGYKSKFICSCGFEEFFKETVQEKVSQIKGGSNDNNSSKQD
ncbi:MAG: hypothetical protein DDT19_01900 [Syntrophomonadaceae bacterium]|nr:hypothetical protein [Bacillota bacterium]